METVQNWNCKNYHEAPTETSLHSAWETLKQLREKCERVYPDALEGIQAPYPYDYWNWLFQVYYAIRKNRPDIACAYALDLLHFTAVQGNYEKRVLAVIIRVLEGQHNGVWPYDALEKAKKDSRR